MLYTLFSICAISGADAPRAFSAVATAGASRPAFFISSASAWLAGATLTCAGVVASFGMGAFAPGCAGVTGVGAFLFHNNSGRLPPVRSTLGTTGAGAACDGAGVACGVAGP